MIYKIMGLNRRIFPWAALVKNEHPPKNF